MNTILKSAIAGALALAATSAFAVSTPDTGSSDLILVIQNENTPADVYALDLSGISINTIFPTSGLAASSANLSTAISGINTTIQASAALQSFLQTNPASQDGWTIESAQYSATASNQAARNSNSNNPGQAAAVFSSPGNAENIGSTTYNGFKTLLNGIESDMTQPADGLGLKALTSPGVTESTTVSLSASAASKYGVFTTVSDLGAVGSSLALYGLTGNGDGLTTQSFILGSATLAANGTLTFAANAGGGGGAPVPLPAAVWLFGSGIMGLVGISRRRKAAAAV